MEERVYQKDGEKSGNVGREIKFTREEQEAMYAQCIDAIMQRTRDVLDNLEYLPEFQVNWESYGKNRPFASKNRKLYK